MPSFKALLTPELKKRKTLLNVVFKDSQNGHVNAPKRNGLWLMLKKKKGMFFGQCSKQEPVLLQSWEHRIKHPSLSTDCLLVWGRLHSATSSSEVYTKATSWITVALCKQICSACN